MTRTNGATDCDIAVVGAGPAGVCAAAAAARGGAKVLLIDFSPRLGGSVSDAMHRCMCGLYSAAPNDPTDTLNGSAQRDVIRRMMMKEPSRVVPRQLGKAWVLEFPASAWARSLGEICDESKAEVLLGTKVAAVRREGNQIIAIALRVTPSPGNPREGRGEGIDEPKSNGRPSPQPSPGLPGEGEMPCYWIGLKAIVDCTGGGALLKLAGEDSYQAQADSSQRMLCGYAARLSGISGDSELLRLQIPYALAQAVEKNKLPRVARFTVFYPGPAVGDGICKLAVDQTELNDDQAAVFLDDVIQHLKHEIPALAQAEIVEKSPRILPRDGLRLAGRFVLTEDDVLNARVIGDDSVHAWWPIEKWDVATGPSYAYPPAGRHYDIPPDALRSAAIENLFAAGACLSATQSAAASSRASGICLATGDAAGRLAAGVISYRGR
jgi:hypothetical protein